MDLMNATAAYFHPEFDGIYFMLDGWIHLKTYDPATGAYAEQRIGQNELAFFPRACTTSSGRPRT
jgi:hypothetical protein